ncbi:MAG: hypothetical protein HY840_06810 [Bacteroidetes bacterium]|nr:hypothetical protein [Bacteroidota bacterium]
MKRVLIITMGIMAISLYSGYSFSQATDEVMKYCTKYISHPYISDGQQYRALLNGDEVAEFHATFYGGSTYRIAACSGQNEANLIFSVYDSDRHLLFTNKDYENTPYWDFKFKTTIDCIIETQLDQKNKTSGLAIMLIGFKQ